MAKHTGILLGIVVLGVAMAIRGKSGPTGKGVWVGLTNGYRYEVQEQADGDWFWWRYDAEWDIGLRGSAASKDAAKAAAIASAVGLPPAQSIGGTGLDEPLAPRCDTDPDDPNPSPPGCFW